MSNQGPVLPGILRRLFAVFWWMLVIGSVTTALWHIHLGREAYRNFLQEEAEFDRTHPHYSPPVDASGNPAFDPSAPSWVVGDYPLVDFTFEPKEYLWPVVRLYGAILTLPYAIMTLMRWIATGHWRFGPRW